MTKAIVAWKRICNKFPHRVGMNMSLVCNDQQYNIYSSYYNVSSIVSATYLSLFYFSSIVSRNIHT